VFLLILISLNSLGKEQLISKFEFRDDSSNKSIAKTLHPKSHINIFLPSIPYSYISKSTNAGLIRSYDNKQGWVMIWQNHIKE